MKKTTIHIGKLIRKRLKFEGRSASWLAEQVNCERSNMYRIFKNNHIDTVLLLKISLALHYDFFAYYSKFIDTN